MSKATRMLAMTGMALVAGVMFSAGPAAASSSTAQGTTTATQSTQQAAQADRGRTWVQGTYRTRIQCVRVGLVGQRFDRWDEFRCVRVHRGFRTYYRLVVQRDWHGGGHWNDGHGNGNWDNDHDHDHGGGHWDNNRPRR
jgi:hypothetical protein